MAHWNHVGVDWDSGEWLAVGFIEESTFEASSFPSIETLWEDVGRHADRLVIDVPIGLCGSKESLAGCKTDEDGDLTRKCDRLARKLIGTRWSSVFNPPCRTVAREAVSTDYGYSRNDETYDQLNASNREHTGKGLMQQALSIAPGIVEVEDLLLENEDARRTIHESHPELAFRALADMAPDFPAADGGGLRFSKKTAPGFAEREVVLSSTDEYESGTWQRIAEGFDEDEYVPGIDDLMDAIVLALTASADAGEFHHLPGDERYPVHDVDSETDVALPMEMVYRRNKPFDLDRFE